MDVNDTQGNGPDQEPTVEGPQAPAGDQPTAEHPSAGGPAPKRLTRSRATSTEDCLVRRTFSRRGSIAAPMAIRCSW